MVEVIIMIMTIEPVIITVVSGIITEVYDLTTTGFDYE